MFCLHLLRVTRLPEVVLEMQALVPLEYEFFWSQCSKFLLHFNALPDANLHLSPPTNCKLEGQRAISHVFRTGKKNNAQGLQDYRGQDYTINSLGTRGFWSQSVLYIIIILYYCSKYSAMVNVHYKVHFIWKYGKMH
jgi:hypothetical protein